MNHHNLKSRVKIWTGLKNLAVVADLRIFNPTLKCCRELKRREVKTPPKLLPTSRSLRLRILRNISPNHAAENFKEEMSEITNFLTFLVVCILCAHFSESKLVTQQLNPGPGKTRTFNLVTPQHFFCSFDYLLTLPVRHEKLAFQTNSS